MEKEVVLLLQRTEQSQQFNKLLSTDVDNYHLYKYSKQTSQNYPALLMGRKWFMLLNFLSPKHHGKNW